MAFEGGRKKGMRKKITPLWCICVAIDYHKLSFSLINPWNVLKVTWYKVTRGFAQHILVPISFVSVKKFWPPNFVIFKIQRHWHDFISSSHTWAIAQIAHIYITVMFACCVCCTLLEYGIPLITNPRSTRISVVTHSAFAVFLCGHGSFSVFG